MTRFRRKSTPPSKIAVEDQLSSDAVQEKIDAQLTAVVRPQVETAVESEVRSQVEAAVRAQARQQVSSSVEAEIRKAVLQELAQSTATPEPTATPAPTVAPAAASGWTAWLRRILPTRWLPTLRVSSAYADGQFTETEIDAIVSARMATAEVQAQMASSDVQ